MKLYCHSDYNNGAAGLHFGRGWIEVTPETANFLLRDAPENFSTVAVEGKAPDAPPFDKAVKKPAVKKGKT